MISILSHLLSWIEYNEESRWKHSFKRERLSWREKCSLLNILLSGGHRVIRSGRKPRGVRKRGKKAAKKSASKSKRKKKEKIMTLIYTRESGARGIETEASFVASTAMTRFFPKQQVLSN